MGTREQSKKIVGNKGTSNRLGNRGTRHVNAARFPEMAKERGMANMPNMSSQRVYLLKGKQSL